MGKNTEYKNIRIKNDLILEKNLHIDGSLEVNGNIICREGRYYSLYVKGSVKAKNIILVNIYAGGDINVHNIIAYGDIHALNITAKGSIEARDHIIAEGNINVEKNIVGGSFHIKGNIITKHNIDATTIEVGGKIYANNILCRIIKHSNGVRLPAKYINANHIITYE